MQKYVMTTSTKVVCGVTLTQIQRVSDGVFGFVAMLNGS